MKIADLGEFGLIDRLGRIIQKSSDNIILGMGDDAAVLNIGSNRFSVLTTDAMVEGVHFDLKYTPLESLGWKTLAINLSDIAAVGAIPRFAVVSIAIPEKWKVEDVELLYRGIKSCGDEYGCVVVGGDTTRSKNAAFISVTVLGEVEREFLISRSGARIGDFLCVTGELGGARLGLETLKGGSTGDRFSRSIKKFLMPEARINQARKLIRELRIDSMIDISDGLSSEIHHLCKQSGLGCIIWAEKIPIAEEVMIWAERKKISPLMFALESGEEYELLFTADPDRIRQWQEKDREPFISVIGEMIPKHRGILIEEEGKRKKIPFSGWEHFCR